MNKKVSVSIAGVVLLTLLGAPVAAMADDENQPPVYPSNVQIHQDDSDDHEDDEDDEDDDDDDDDDHKKGWIPPVFVVPGKKHQHHKPKPGSTTVAPTAGAETDDDDLPTGTAGTSSISGMDTNDFVVVGVDDTAAAESLESVNPKRAQPVAIELVKVTTQTPADRFMDTAYLGIGLMALSALGLGATTAVRSYRLRKSGKSDYFYDN